MAQKSAYELEREANIARNKALLEQLALKQAVDSLGFPPKSKPAPKPTAKPVQSKRPKKEKVEPDAPRRQSLRLKNPVDPDENPSQKRKREVRSLC
jgi:WD repeat-containing protein 76